MMSPGMFISNELISLLLIYVRCDLRGTKGDNGSAKDLGGAKKIKDANGKELMEVELPTAREDVDSLWMASRNALRHKPVEEKEHRDAATKQADHDRNSRTNTVLTWIGTNMWVRPEETKRHEWLTDPLQGNDHLLHLWGIPRLGAEPFRR